MDALVLSRWQFAAAAMFHFLFVPLTLGLSILVAIMETRYARTGERLYLQMTRFWGKIFLLNFVLGVVTGITLEFQFGTNWSRYSAFVGDVFGSLLAIEATAAFFLESTLIGVWAFGWKKLSAKRHAAVMWLIAGASTLSAVWILIANAWMQHPVGFVLRNGRAELESLAAVIFQGWAVLEFLHTLSAAYLLSAFFVMGVSAYHLLKKQHLEIFIRSFRMALPLGLVFSLFLVIEGHFHGADLADKQPGKLAAMEAHWDTKTQAPIYLLALPDDRGERNLVELGPIPGMLSFLARHDFQAEVKGLKDIPRSERPPVLINYLATRVMIGLGFYFVLMTVIGWRKRERLVESKGYLKLMLYSIPLPHIAIQAGWVLAEVGRQPWIVYGLMKTSEAFSPLDATQVFISLAAFILVYSLFGIIGFYLIAGHVRKGPAWPEPERG